MLYHRVEGGALSDGRVGTFLALAILAVGSRLAGSRGVARSSRGAPEPVDPTRGPFRTMAEVRAANRAKHAANQGVYFFDRGKKRFHRDRAYAGPYRGRYFGVLSGNTGWNLYRIEDNGDIDHIGRASEILGETILDKADVRRAAEVAAEREREKAGSRELRATSHELRANRPTKNDSRVARDELESSSLVAHRSLLGGSRGVARSGRPIAAVVAKAPAKVILRKDKDDDPYRKRVFWYRVEVLLDDNDYLWESPRTTDRGKAMKAAVGMSNSLGKAHIEARNHDDVVGAILREGRAGSGIPVRIAYGESGRLHVQGLVGGTWIQAAGDGFDSDEEISATIDRWFDSETAERLFREAVPSGSRGVARSSRPSLASWPQACRIGDLKYPPYELSDMLRAQVLDLVEKGDIVDALKAIRKAHDTLSFGHENLHRAQITMYVEAIRAGLPGKTGSTLADWWKGDIRSELLK